MTLSTELQQALRLAVAASPIEPSWWQRPALTLDLSAQNPRLRDFDPADPTAFSTWIAAEMQQRGAEWALGGYGEDRVVYSMSPLFAGAGEARSVHLGLDIWLPAGSTVHAALAGRVHSLADNARFGDYGPTVILEHELGGHRLYTLHGHLARRTLDHLNTGQTVQAGELLGWLGTADENLGWPPHLHFQLISQIGEHRGDFPGVSSASQQQQWLAQCPNPQDLLHNWFRLAGIV